MAVAELYEELHSRVERWLLGRIHDQPTAQDLASEAWLRCLVAERRGQDVQGGYVWRAAQSVLMDELRRRKIRRTEPIPQWVEWSMVAPDPSPDETLEVDRVLEEEYSKLTVRQRPAVRLRALGYSHPEIAELLGLSLDSAKKRILYARHTMAIA